jgi:hypothetical protein
MSTCAATKAKLNNKLKTRLKAEAAEGAEAADQPAIPSSCERYMYALDRAEWVEVLMML